GNNYGVLIAGQGATGNVVAGNAIGTDVKGTVPIRNAKDGILITQGASNNTIGGTVDGAGNIIAYNAANGITIISETPNHILSNRIFANNLLGIDLGGDGITANHASPAAGPNNFQNFPVLTSIVAGALSSTIRGTIQGAPLTSFLVQFFSNSV